MIDRPTSLVNLITYSDTERVLLGDDSLVSMVWYKHGFQQCRSNFNGKFVRFKGYVEAKLGISE